jgi:hypothetical protein
MKTISILAIIFSVIFLSACVEFPETVNSKIDSSTQNKLSAQIENQEITKDKIYSILEDINVDYLNYKVTKVETFTEMDSYFINKKTEGKFIKVSLEIKNMAKETKQIFTPRFTLIDSQERRFSELAGDSSYIADGLEWIPQLQPGLAISGAIVFEVPKDSENLTLEISGDFMSNTKVQVFLSKIQNIGKDTTLKDEADKKINDLMGTPNKNTDIPSAVVVKNSDKGVTLIIHELKIVKKDEDWGRIEEVQFTIDNKGAKTISPKLLVYLYRQNDDLSLKAQVKEEISVEGMLQIGESTTQKIATKAGYRGDITEPITMKISLVDSFDWDKTNIVSIYKDITFS